MCKLPTTLFNKIYVIESQTDNCFNYETCIGLVKTQLTSNVFELDHILTHYIVTGDGSIYEGARFRCNEAYNYN